MKTITIDYGKITETWADFFRGFVDNKSDKKFIKLKEIEKAENVIVHQIRKNTPSAEGNGEIQVIVYYFMGLSSEGNTCQFATLVPK